MGRGDGGGEGVDGQILFEGKAQFSTSRKVPPFAISKRLTNFTNEKNKVPFLLGGIKAFYFLASHKQHIYV